jgi:Bacterial regulatory proteins, luxR family
MPQPCLCRHLRGAPVTVAPAGELPLMLEEARSFFAVEGVEALRAFLDDGHSIASQSLKARARAEGNKQIAWRLAISEKTVKAHMTSIFGRIGVADRTQAALWAQRHGV